MKLEELFAVLTDYTNVNVYNLEGSKVAFYDGKNSIDEKYNNIEIHHVSVKNNTLEITLWIEAE